MHGQVRNNNYRFDITITKSIDSDFFCRVFGCASVRSDNLSVKDLNGGALKEAIAAIAIREPSDNNASQPASASSSKNNGTLYIYIFQ